MDAEDRREDQVYFLRTVEAFKRYSQHALLFLETRRRQVLALPQDHLELLELAAMETVYANHRAAIRSNQLFLNGIIEASASLFEAYWPNGISGPKPTAGELEPTALDMDKVYSTLRQFVRDWSAEGEPERRSVYGPIIELLTARFPDPVDRNKRQVSVLGAGLSRLSVELATLGFAVQGNEFSYHMLIGGHFAMNHCTEREQHLIQPYCDGTLNLFSRDHQFRKVAVPDFTCYDHMDFSMERGCEFGQLSMVAGDFTEVFSKPEQHETWDLVVTCFFIDTAHNIVEYLKIIYAMLKPGGIWVNAGPLLYHFSECLNETSIDLSYEEIKKIAAKIGFTMQSESTISTTYTNNPYSMKQLVYRCPFFCCQK